MDSLKTSEIVISIRVRLDAYMIERKMIRKLGALSRN